MADLDMNQIQILSSDLRAVSDATYPAKTALASEYNASIGYDIGDYCIRTGLLYRCIVTVPYGGEAWNSNHWTEVDITSEIKNNTLYFTDIAVSATTGDIVSLSDTRITTDHVVAECVFANSSYITSDVAWTTAAGSLILNGTCTTATTVNILLVKKVN